MRRPLVACALVAGLVLVTAGCGGDDGGDEVSTTGGTEPVTSMTTAPGEPLTVADVADLPDGSEVTVLAFVFQPDEGATVLCDTLGESYPPTCVGPTLVTNGLDVHVLPGLESTSGGDLVAPATWTTAPVEVAGTLADGALQVS